MSIYLYTLFPSPILAVGCCKNLCASLCAGGENAKDKANKALANNEMVSLARRMTTLELKELNERQRAEHAHKMYEQMRNSLRQVEERNLELEAKFAEVRHQRNLRNVYLLFPREALFSRGRRQAERGPRAV